MDSIVDIVSDDFTKNEQNINAVCVEARLKPLGHPVANVAM